MATKSNLESRIAKPEAMPNCRCKQYARRVRPLQLPTANGEN